VVSELFSTYGIFIPKQMKTVVNRDIKFEEDFSSRKSHELFPMIDDEEKEVMRVESGSPVISR
jgi:hypothetical protein